MKYHTLVSLMSIIPYLLFLKKLENFKLSSAANYRWPFMGSEAIENLSAY